LRWCSCTSHCRSWSTTTWHTSCQCWQSESRGAAVCIRCSASNWLWPARLFAGSVLHGPALSHTLAARVSAALQD
jgi:hypothetical protein